MVSQLLLLLLICPVQAGVIPRKENTGSQNLGLSRASGSYSKYRSQNLKEKLVCPVRAGVILGEAGIKLIRSSLTRVSGSYS